MMIVELRSRLGIELDRLSQELEDIMVRDSAPATQPPAGSAGDGQRALRHQIALLGQLISGLACVDPAAIPSARAGYGSVVRVRDANSGQEEVYTLMTGDFIDLDEGQVSLASPIGQALLGRRPGERVSVVTPRGARRYDVVGVLTLPVRLGVEAAGRKKTALQVA